jgi:hypothetical protein
MDRICDLNQFLKIEDDFYFVKREMTRIPIGFKHFVDGSCPVKRMTDDQNPNRFFYIVDRPCLVTVTTIIPIGFKHFVDGSCPVERVTTIIPIGFKHFLDGSYSVKRVPDNHFSNRF